MLEANHVAMATHIDEIISAPLLTHHLRPVHNGLGIKKGVSRSPTHDRGMQYCA